MGLLRSTAVQAALLGAWLTACRGATPAAPSGPPDNLRCEKAPHSECFVHIDAGSGLLGAQSTDPGAPNYDADASPNEGPPHEERWGELWIMAGEVPIPALKRCVAAGTCPSATIDQRPALTNFGKADRDSHPINAISWPGAAEVCATLGGRLPTEVEWEAAARGFGRWPWGDYARCGVQEDVDVSLSSGMSKPAEMTRPPCLNRGTSPLNNRGMANERGLAGLAGNVAEWTSDLYALPGQPPAPGETRHTLRGGGWMTEDPADLRVTVRVPALPEEAGPDVGFRCVWGQP